MSNTHTIGLATTIAYKHMFPNEVKAKNITILRYLQETNVITYQYIAATKQMQHTPTIAYEGLFCINLDGEIFATEAYTKFLCDIIIPKMTKLGYFNRTNTLRSL